MYIYIYINSYFNIYIHNVNNIYIYIYIYIYDSPLKIRKIQNITDLSKHTAFWSLV